MQEKEKTTIADEDFNKYIILKKDLTPNERARLNYHIKIGSLKAYKSQYGMAVLREDAINSFSQDGRSRSHAVGGYQIDLSTGNKINCLYRRISNMNKYNKNIVCRDNKLTRYIDQDGQTCINIKEYLAPQVKLMAKRLELKEYLVYGAIFDLLHRLWEEERG